jgi:hypothetical protein
VFNGSAKEFGGVIDVHPIAYLIARAHEDAVAARELSTSVPQKLLPKPAAIDRKKTHYRRGKPMVTPV